MSAPLVIFAGLNCHCGERHTQGAAYYVSCRRDDGHHALLAGPYPEHHQALDVLDTVKRLAMDFGDPRAHWYSYGTLAIHGGSTTTGVLNDALAAELERIATTPCDHGPLPSCPRQDARKILRVTPRKKTSKPERPKACQCPSLTVHRLNWVAEQCAAQTDKEGAR